MSTDQIALINLYLQAGYVFLTLVIAIGAIWAILSNSKQSREALYSQHKPVIVPTPRRDSLNPLLLTMQNKGTGVALNTWGVFNTANTKTTILFILSLMLAK